MRIRTASIAAVLACAACLAGCTVGTLTTGYPEPGICGGYETDFTAAVSIVMPDNSGETEFSFGGHICRLGSGFWSMELTSPETVTGMKISAADDVLSSQLDGLTFDVSAEKLPDSSPVTSLFIALDNAAADINNGAQLQKGEDGWVLSCNNSTIIFDENGYPSAMAVTEPRMNVEFSAFGTDNPDDDVISETTDSIK